MPRPDALATHPERHGRPPLRSVLFLVASILLAGCATDGASTGSPPAQPSPLAVTVRSEGKAASAPGPVSLGMGGTLTLELPVTTGTGYLWELTLDPIGLLDGDLEGTTVRQDGAMPGAVTDQRWLLKALAPGRTTIRATYRRPWERDVEPARRFSVEVEVTGASVPPPKS